MIICEVSFFFFFKQKTAYEMRISDWSSDVCSSDLQPGAGARAQPAVEAVVDQRIADRRGQAVTERIAQIAAGLERIAFAVGEELLVEPDFVVRELITARERPIFGERNARTKLEAGRDLAVGRLPIAAAIIERVVITPEDVRADRSA